MEYEGMTDEVVASGMNAGINGSTTGSGSGAGFGATGFFFLGFLDIIALPTPPARQQQHKAVKRSHCHVLK
jgi:hypothetical protein